jgi:aldehyde:ferredoxin oxidoreductase
MFAQNENTSKRTLKQIMESLHLDTMFTFYNVHFATYNMNKKQTIQLIPNAMWKDAYAEYLKEYSNSSFVEETLKDRLCDTLKELKTKNSNEGGVKESHTLM